MLLLSDAFTDVCCSVLEVQQQCLSLLLLVHLQRVTASLQKRLQLQLKGQHQLTELLAALQQLL